MVCFKFYLIAVLIGYLYFIKYRRAHNVLGTLWRVSLLTKFVADGLELGKKWGVGCSRNIMLSAMVCWGVFSFQGVLYNYFLSFLAFFCFNLYIGNFLTTITCIKNPFRKYGEIRTRKTPNMDTLRQYVFYATLKVCHNSPLNLRIPSAKFSLLNVLKQFCKSYQKQVDSMLIWHTKQVDINSQKKRNNTSRKKIT